MSATAVGPLSPAAAPEPAIVLKSFNTAIVPAVKSMLYTREPYTNSFPGLDAIISTTTTSIAVPVAPDVAPM